MSLTKPQDAKSSSVKTDWLFKLYYTDEGADDWIGLSSSDRIVSGAQYYGCVIDSGQIERRLDLYQSLASVSDLTIICQNIFKTDTLSAELFGSANNYYNHKVLIYEYWVNTATAVFLNPEFRIKGLSHDDSTVTITLEAWTPFDNVVIPNLKSTINGVYSPIVYGDHPGHGIAEQTYRHLVPHKEVTGGSAYKYYAAGSARASSGLYYYDPLIDKYTSFTSYQAAASVSWNNLAAFKLKHRRLRKFYVRPDTHNGSEFDSTNEWVTNSEQGYNDDTSNFAQSPTLSTTTVEGTETADFILKMPQLIGSITVFTVYVYNVITVTTADADVTNKAALTVSVDDGDTWHEINTRGTVGATSAGWHNTGDIDADLTAHDSLGGRKIPEEIIIRLENTAGDATGSVISYGRVMDVYIDIEIAMDRPDEESERIFHDTHTIYSDSTGYDKDYTDGSGTANEPHEVHRDIMDRFAGVDYDDDYMPGFSTLNTDRNLWQVRIWEYEPRTVRSILEQLQFEGGFVTFPVADSDGSGNAGIRWVHIENAYVNADFPDTDGDPVVFVFSEKHYDILNISLTDYSDIITNTQWQFNRDPKDNKYYDERTYDNTTARDAYNLGTSHVVNFEFDYLVDCGNVGDDIYDSVGDSDPNDSIVLYYDNIWGNPKILVSCTVEDANAQKVELGDIVQFNDSNIDPYGKAWGDLFFMIVEERRSINGLDIIAREVYETP